jgi:translocation and assembly module TamB
VRAFGRILAHITTRGLAAIAVLLLLIALSVILVVRSGWFREKVRERIVYEIEKATGGRAELGQFDLSWTNLTARVDSLVVHGKESSGEPPFIRVESVDVGIRVLSALERRVDLADLRVTKPRVRIAIYADGTTNLPSPSGPKGGKIWTAAIIDLAVKRYAVVDGIFEYDNREIPLNLRGENLAVEMNYDSALKAYAGELRSARVRVMTEGVPPLEANVTAGFRIEETRIVLPKVTVIDQGARAELAGTLEDPQKPHGTFTVKASTQVRDLVRLFNVPLKPVGSGAFDGRINVGFGEHFQFIASGKASGSGLGYAHDRLNIDGADGRADVLLTKDSLTVTAFTANALGANISGRLQLPDWRKLHMDGDVKSLDVHRTGIIFSDRALPWNGTLEGSYSLDTTRGKQDTVARANLNILPGAESNSIEGAVEFTYDEAADTLELGESHLYTQTTRLDVSGTLGRVLSARVHTRNLDDLLPVLTLIEDNPASLPLKLEGGAADADGIVTGPLENPLFKGHLLVTKASVQGHGFDRFEATGLDVSKDRIRATRAALVRGSTLVSGPVDLQAKEGSFENAAISTNLTVQNLSITEAMKEFGPSSLGQRGDVSGILSATLRANGTIREPQGDGSFEIQRPAAYGQHADVVRGSLRVSNGLVELTGGDITHGPARVRFSGSYRHPNQDFQSGDVRFQVAAQSITPDRVEAIAKLQPPVGGILNGTLEGSGRLENSRFTLLSAAGTASLANFTYDRQPVGDLALKAETTGSDLALTVNGKVREANITGQGSWKLGSEEAGTVSVKFSRMDVQTVHKLVMLGGSTDQEASALPFDGYVEGHAIANVRLRAPSEFQAEVTLDTLQLRARPSLAPAAVAKALPAGDIDLHNTKPVLFAVNAKGATIRSAEFAGRDTTISATGSVPFDGAGNADFSVRGDLNLTILQLLSPDLTATGAATMQATVRGALRDPSVNGRMELKGASVYFGDLPNGLDNANGTFIFDRKRATIDHLTAETGGGKLSLTGYLEFGPSVIYRLQADAKQVRLRWPEDLSTTFDAKLALNGTAEQSTLSGSITLDRAAFSARADLGQLFASSTRPVPTTSSPNDLLRGMQFDVRIGSGPNFDFETSLTRDVEAEVDLRLRGTPLRPVLLGDISVNQGEIQVLGNRYTVNRGDLHFLNPVKIEPTLDLELETRARGITVNVTLSGTIDRLRVNYSSDPPLQSNDIVALLAVGRDPSLASNLATTSATGSGTGITSAGLGLLGEAASEQLSSRLQRFIGSSHVKIDPTITGVDNLPQARLTIEQQVSRDVTLTYITNLNRTQEQIVQVQWDFSKKWSAIAVRDANGLFGIDFLYRKRF